jgi:glutamate dehydrogenase
MIWEQEFRKLYDRFTKRRRLELQGSPREIDFPESYRLSTAPRDAVRDALSLAEIFANGRDALRLSLATRGEAHGLWRLALYCSQPRNLDEILPLLGNTGLRVIDQTHFAVVLEGRTLFIRDFRVTSKFAETKWSPAVESSLAAAMDALLSGKVEDDILNGLILRTRLEWRQVDLLRAYCNYYLQLSDRFDQRRIHGALLTNFQSAGLLYRYFEARFKPDAKLGGPSEREIETLPAIRQELIDALDEVDDVAEDRILRDIFNLIDSTWRSNFFLSQRDATPCISLKIGSLGVINMPSPRPFAEIYVHARFMEGVHLRGAKVARGGVRWSERPDDFRTEILELMSTQMVKNVVIVPQGAKGGFVLKASTPGFRGSAEKGREAYGVFMRGLLDLTDNPRGAGAERPAALLCYDDPDPYLVVAADRGTASFSDYANEIAAEYGFWLGDAFATGGSHGFHHKKLGITARGAWICVQRHFREIGYDVDEHILSVIGVGGMEGDVFGNGMLLSNNIRLLGAFNAEYIFIDPNPDRQVSFMERRRLFEKPGSTWEDYDRALISPGGGVYQRSAKDIFLSPEAVQWLGARSTSLDGDAVIRLMLAAPADLLWMGGIGSYVKASTETNESVADHLNDAARVDATVLRAKVVGEGANLGFTQKARIEYALNGGRINTDAIDNSAGVDLSDHEVNLKILMSSPANGAEVGSSREERNLLLRELADEVCAQVLDNNYHQSLCLSLERERCRSDLGPFLEAADHLENAGLLDRVVEVFPSRKEMLARGDQGLTRPELAILVAKGKLALKRALLEAQDVLDEDWAQALGADYFPARARARYGSALKEHLLGREIAGAVICNKIIDQAGIGFLAAAGALDPARVAEAVGLYIAFDQILQGHRWRDAVRALDGKMTPERQYELLLQLEEVLAFLCRWAWEHGRRLRPDPLSIERWREELTRYQNYLKASPEFTVLASAAPDAARLLFLNRLRDFPVLVDLSRTIQQNLGEVAEAYEDFLRALGLRQLATLLSELKPRDVWEHRLQGSLDDELRSAAARFVRVELNSMFRDFPAFIHGLGLETRLAKIQALRSELIEADPVTLVPFAALISEVHSFVDACAAASGAAQR